MKFFIIILIAFSTKYYSQNIIERLETFKGEHYALYSKCLSPITFCEITQQTYTSCGSVKNCYGLYVMPGDTFYVNIEDKNRAEVISADISFGGYFPAISNVIFQPIDNNCVPIQALQIVIPLSSVLSSSFQIEAQNTMCVNTPSLTPGVPAPFNIYVGGQQPQFTFALSDFTVCPLVDDVSIEDNEQIIDATIIYPNPVKSIVTISNKSIYSHNSTIEIKNYLGQVVFSSPFTAQIDLHKLSAGMYFLTIEDRKVMRTIKFIKE